jgi:hypothetical protein
MTAKISLKNSIRCLPRRLRPQKIFRQLAVPDHGWKLAPLRISGAVLCVFATRRSMHCREKQHARWNVRSPQRSSVHTTSWANAPCAFLNYQTIKEKYRSELAQWQKSRWNFLRICGLREKTKAKCQQNQSQIESLLGVVQVHKCIISRIEVRGAEVIQPFWRSNISLYLVPIRVASTVLPASEWVAWKKDSNASFMMLVVM